jgi:hypothetical protein
MKKRISTLVLANLLFSIVLAWGDNTKNSDKKNPKPATSSAAAATAATSNFTGWVSDEQCGARVDAKCNKLCYSKGVKLVFVSTDKKVLAVTNQDSLKNFVGQQVTIQGSLQNGALMIASVKPIK